MADWPKTFTSTIPAGSDEGPAIATESYTRGSFQLPRLVAIEPGEDEQSSDSESSSSESSQSTSSSSQSASTSSDSSDSSSAPDATITWLVSNDGVNYDEPLAADGTAATSTVTGISPLRSYDLPIVLFNFASFKPRFGVEQPEGLDVTYRLA
jgi:hypothetical protein